MNLPNLLTYLRILLIPLLVIAYYLPYRHAHLLAMTLFVVAAITDWLDGYLARKLNQSSPFGAFLDPVADKLMVAAALLLLVSDENVHAQVFDERLFVVVVLVIIGREIAVSALREWMAEMGKRSSVAVSIMGKLKTVSQMVAIPFLLLGEPVLGVDVFTLGEMLLYVAAGLTLWSMLVYLRAAWPELMRPRSDR
ncbi:MAG: CDP-diacylglycerol--glycerol-3-phosphate 3-phosphatidyltransferase [Acidiferrobacterales bacterium]